MLTEKLLDNKEIIDVISEWNLQVVLNNSNVDRIVLDFWNGPYEEENWLNKSYLFQEIESIFVSSNLFLGYSKKINYKYSIENFTNSKFSKQKHMHHKIKKSHFFHFLRWNHSIKVKYIAEAISICIIWLSLFVSISTALNMHQDFNDLESSYDSYSTQLTNSSLTSSQISSLKSSQQLVWNQILEKSHQNTDSINNSWIISFL